MNRTKTIITVLIILAVSAASIFWIFSTEPVAEQEAATKKSAMLVEVMEVRQGDFQPVISATGTVQPANNIILSPRVSGEVISVSKAFVPGSVVKKGEVLVQIDPVDFENTLALRKSDLEVAKAQLALEMGRQEAAANDYRLAKDDVETINENLLLRRPQLNTARANVNAAEVLVKQAKLALERTTIRAPFDAHIVTRNANQGSQVTPGTNLGRLVGVDEYWIILNIPIGKVNWIQLPDGSDFAPENVKLTNSSWSKGSARYGKLFKLIGTLTDQTRFAQVLVTVKDPISKGGDLPNLIIGTFVEAQVPAKELKEVVRLNRDYLRKGETVWVMDAGKLAIRDVNVLFEDQTYAYIKDGLENGDQVVTTNLSTVVDGAALRIESGK